MKFDLFQKFESLEYLCSEIKAITGCETEIYKNDIVFNHQGQVFSIRSMFKIIFRLHQGKLRSLLLTDTTDNQYVKEEDALNPRELAFFNNSHKAALGRLNQFVNPSDYVGFIDGHTN